MRWTIRRRWRRRVRRSARRSRIPGWTGARSPARPPRSPQRALSTPASRVALPQELLETGPLVVGATGGSGTRVVARILRRAGLFTGSELNESEDAWKLGDYSDRWINEYLAHREGPLPADVERAMIGELGELLRDHCRAVPPARPWGWKEPRSIYLLEPLHRWLPGLRFLHVVRDGRDMALSANQNQLRKHGDAAGIPGTLTPRARSAALWAWVNLTAARYGERRLRSRYLRIRFEDLCASPDTVARMILDFAGLEGAADAQLDVLPPDTLGRWRREDPEAIRELEEVAHDALSAFGYLTDPDARSPRAADTTVP